MLRTLKHSPATTPHHAKPIFQIPAIFPIQLRDRDREQIWNLHFQNRNENLQPNIHFSPHITLVYEIGGERKRKKFTSLKHDSCNVTLCYMFRNHKFSTHYVGCAS
jgi:hypothetical protein